MKESKPKTPMKKGNFSKSHPWRQESYVTSPKGVARVRRKKKVAEVTLTKVEPEHNPFLRDERWSSSNDETAAEYWAKEKARQDLHLELLML